MLGQTLAPASLAVHCDYGEGAWSARNKAVAMAQTEWIAFVDDDDEMLPHHLESLWYLASERKADVASSWFNVIGGVDPFPANRGEDWDVKDPHVFPITVLVKRSLIMESGALFKSDSRQTGDWEVQDFPFWRSLSDAGGVFAQTAEITWNWHHHSANTSGLPERVV